LDAIEAYHPGGIAGFVDEVLSSLAGEGFDPEDWLVVPQARDLSRRWGCGRVGGAIEAARPFRGGVLGPDRQ